MRSILATRINQIAFIFQHVEQHNFMDNNNIKTGMGCINDIKSGIWMDQLY